MMNNCSVLEWINSVETCIFTVDRAGQITSWNRATEALLGYLSDDVIDQPMFPLIGCSHSQFNNIIARKDGSAEHRLRLLTKFDQPIHVILKTSVQRDPTGAFVGLVCFVEEIKIPFMNGNCEPSIGLTDNMDIHSTLIIGLDESGCIDVWNDKAAGVTGYSKEEALGRNMLDMVGHSHPDDGVGQLFQNSMTTKGELNFKIALRTKVGEFRRLALTSTARFNHGGQRIGTVFLALDVTEVDSYPRSPEMMLQTKFIEMTQLIEKANIAVFGIGVDGNVNEWNDKMFEISGYDKRAAFGQNFVDAFVVVSLQQSVQEIVDGGLQGEGTSGFELELRTIYGDIRYFLLNASTRRDFLGNITGVLFIAEDVTEQAQHDRAIASMARELRQLVDTANAPIFGIDVDGLLNEWNEKTAEITGFSGDEAFNRPFVETFIVPKLRTSVQDVLDNALKGRGTSNYELEVRTKSSEIRFLLVNATTRRDAENKIVGVVVVAQDVTEAAKHDRAVAAMANELRQLIDNANAPIFGIDIDGDVNEWNDKTAEITGFTKEEAFDCNLVETFIVPSLRDSVQAILASALEGIGTSNYELEFRTKSNEIRHLLVNATTRRDAENNVVGVVGVAQDVTEAVHRDRAVTSMANELRLLIDTANAPIFGIDNDGNVNEWNNKTAEITGYLKEEAFDQPLVKKFIAPSMRKQVAEIMDKALAGNPTSNYELEIVAKSKEVRVLLVNATTRRDPDNNVVGVVGVAQDVTEDRKHARELREMQYLRASQEAKVETERNMTAYFAHELRNPLGAIDSALNAMPDDLPESAKSLISAMQLCTEFMSSIMNNLLDVRKMEEGKMTLHTVPISLRATLDCIYQMLLPSVRPNVEFLAVCETTGRDWVMGDSHRIQQVLTNVITNAIKYTVSGSITLSFRWVENYVCFACDDTGPGIPKSEQKKLFERYVQRGGAPGTGLGLAIAKHLVDLTGGSIRFDSDPSVKPGTSCIVMMPLPECAAPDIFIQEDDKVIESEISFLVIDDVKMNRIMLKRRIQKGIAPNATIMEAATGEEALLICGTDKFDVIVVDQYMEEAGGVMVGTDVVFAMRRMRIDSIIIGCSGNDMDEQFLEAGADWVWKKPMPSNSKIIKDLRAAMSKKGKDI